MKTETNHLPARAFVSCSLRDEDKVFVDFVCRLLKAHRIETSGTVGDFLSGPKGAALGPPIVLHTVLNFK